MDFTLEIYVTKIISESKKFHGREFRRTISKLLRGVAGAMWDAGLVKVSGGDGSKHGFVEGYLIAARQAGVKC